MRRVMIVVLVAALTAALSGINDTSWAGENPVVQPADVHRQAMAARLAGIPIGSAIEVDPTRGKKFQALLERVTEDAITVTVPNGRYLETRTITLDEIKDVKRIAKIGRRHTGRNVLIVVGVVAAVLVGTCAHAVGTLDKSQPGPDVGNEGRP
jgi:hypothetical protein